MTTNLAAAPMQKVSNLVASSRGTNGVAIFGTATPQGATLDWQQFNVQSRPFQPQGAYIDNSQSLNPLTIGIYAVNGAFLWNITVPAGTVMHTSFPAPNGQTHTITGNGPVSIVYVDYPVMPFLYTP